MALLPTGGVVHVDRDMKDPKLNRLLAWKEFGSLATRSARVACAACISYLDGNKRDLGHRVMLTVRRVYATVP